MITIHLHHYQQNFQFHANGQEVFIYLILIFNFHYTQHTNRFINFKFDFADLQLNSDLKKEN